MVSWSRPLVPDGEAMARCGTCPFLPKPDALLGNILYAKHGAVIFGLLLVDPFAQSARSA